MILLFFMGVIYYYIAYYTLDSFKKNGMAYLIMISITVLFFGGMYYFILNHKDLGHNLLCTGIVSMIANGLLWINHGQEEEE